MELKAFSKRFDHTILKATATKGDIQNLCAEAKEWGFAGVCVNPVWVDFVRKSLDGTDVKTIAVLDFPLGAGDFETKCAEVTQLIDRGAQEIDMVFPLGLYLSGEALRAKEEVQKLQAVSKDFILKVILETCYLTPEQIFEVTTLCAQAGADYVKTSTGFGSRGASVEDVTIMKKAIDALSSAKTKQTQIKASGGIKSAAFALQLIEAGASRLGTSTTGTIIEEFKRNHHHA